MLYLPTLVLKKHLKDSSSFLALRHYPLNNLELYKVDLYTETAPHLCCILSAEEQKFAQTIHNATRKKHYITVRIALRQILEDCLNQTTDSISIAKTAHGKPYLPDYPDIHFNISHSADTLLIAISKIGAVGVDIEQARPQRRDFSGLVEKCFAASEIDYWKELPDPEKATEFYRFWTRKEAFVKAVGRGLALGLSECEIASGESAYFLNIPSVYGQPSDWLLFDLPLTQNLYGAIVIESKRITSDFVFPKIISFGINQS